MFRSLTASTEASAPAVLSLLHGLVTYPSSVTYTYNYFTLAVVFLSYAVLTF